jgi:hypothetical protein
LVSGAGLPRLCDAAAIGGQSRAAMTDHARCSRRRLRRPLHPVPCSQAAIRPRLGARDQARRISSDRPPVTARYHPTADRTVRFFHRRLQRESETSLSSWSARHDTRATLVLLGHRSITHHFAGPPRAARVVPETMNACARRRHAVVAQNPSDSLIEGAKLKVVQFRVNSGGAPALTHSLA